MTVQWFFVILPDNNKKSRPYFSSTETWRASLTVYTVLVILVIATLLHRTITWIRISWIWEKASTVWRTRVESAKGRYQSRKFQVIGLWYVSESFWGQTIWVYLVDLVILENMGSLSTYFFLKHRCIFPSIRGCYRQDVWDWTNWIHIVQDWNWSCASWFGDDAGFGSTITNS